MGNKEYWCNPSFFEKRDAEINEEERLLKDWISQQINLAFENGQSIVGMEDISDWCRAVINQRLSQNKDSLLKWIFNSEQVSAKKSRFIYQIGHLKRENFVL